jgi:hypothetical protein
MSVQIELATAELVAARAALLAQLQTTAQSADLSLRRYQALAEAVAADGSIGSRWPEAAASNQALIAGLGESIPRVLAALAEMVAAPQELQAAGEALGLDLMPNLPR